MDSEDRRRSLWCGNLSEKVTEEILFELLTQAGPVEAVTIPKSRDGSKRNFGFISFKHEESVSYAKALMDGTVLYGRMLRLESRSTSPAENDVYQNTMQRAFSSPDKFFENSVPNGFRNDLLYGRDLRLNNGKNEESKVKNGRWNNKRGGQNRNDPQNNFWNREIWQECNGPQNRFNVNGNFQQGYFNNQGFIQSSLGLPQQFMFQQQHQQRMPMLQIAKHNQFPVGLSNAWTSFR